MRILLTGANGFIGSHLTAALLAAGHQVTGAVRDPAAFRRRFPQAAALAVDMNRDTDSGIWAARLDGIAAVINCAGILQGGRGSRRRRSITCRRWRCSRPAASAACGG